MTSDWTTIIGRLARGLGRAALAGGLTVGAVWLWDVSGGGPPLVLARSVVVVASLLAAAYLVVLSVRLWQREKDQPILTPSRLLLLLVLLSLVVRLVGIDFEISGRYYRDEGIYYEAAQRINEGNLLPESFIYGHLPYYIYAMALWIQSLFPVAMADGARDAGGRTCLESDADTVDQPDHRKSKAYCGKRRIAQL